MSKEVKVVYTDDVKTDYRVVATSFYVDRTKKWQKGKIDKKKENGEER